MDLTLDASLGAVYRSRSQVARVMTQGWVQRELACLSCASPALSPTAQNTKARDFECPNCLEPYELKSTSGHFSRWVLDGQYDTLLRIISSGSAPNLLLMEYDRERSRVRALSAIRRQLLSPLAVVARPKLRPAARRAGWIGCSIDLEHVPSSGRISIVSNSRPVPWPEVQSAWSQVGFVVNLRPESQGWLRDVLACLEELPDTFELTDAYRFEPRLARLHPENRNIQPKIRQQLQVLVHNGLLVRQRPGSYARVSTSAPLADRDPLAA